MKNPQAKGARRGFNRFAEQVGIERNGETTTLYRLDDPTIRSTPIRVTDTMTETQVMRLFEAACLEIVS